MSRIGVIPIVIPSGVKADIKGDKVNIEGPKGKLNMSLPPFVSAKVDGDSIVVSREDDSNKAKAMHGLGRSLLNNMVIGVSEGYEKKLTIIGVGYKAAVSGSKIELNLGYSNPIKYDIPKGIEVKVEANTNITVRGIDKQSVGEVAATIRKFRKPEPYKGKGIRYADEHVIIKEGKTVG